MDEHPGIHRRDVATPRLSIHLREAGAGTPVLFVHGNAASSVFWEEQLLALPTGFRGLAPDLRGYGDTEDIPIDATHGPRDWVDDLLGLLDALDLPQVHLVGHSLGGVVAFALVAAQPARFLTLTLVAPGSPHGFGGCRGPDGEMCWPDAAGSGAGLVKPAFVARLAAGDRSEEDPLASPRAVMNALYWKPPFRPAREEALLTGLLSTKVGTERYPGDFVGSDHWPHTGPGHWGPANALSPRFADRLADRFVAAEPKLEVLWVRGADDRIVSDASLSDAGTLGQLGTLPDWPGPDVFPPQPMVTQVRRVLERYAAAGGAFREVVLRNTGHTPFIEQPDAFADELHALLTGR
ncbi:MAG: alpha/beta hydrolase [Myxococcota bacterium]